MDYIFLFVFFNFQIDEKLITVSVWSNEVKMDRVVKMNAFSNARSYFQEKCKHFCISPSSFPGQGDDDRHIRRNACVTRASKNKRLEKCPSLPRCSPSFIHSTVHKNTTNEIV